MPTTLIVQEAGAALPPPDSVPEASRSERLLVAQHRTEPDTELVVRTTRQLALLGRNHQAASAAVLAVGSPRTGSATASRELVARSLLRHLAESDGGELVLFARDASPELRHDVMTLASALVPALAGTHVRVRVRFDAEPAATRARRPAA
jgi:hypothetical protein